MDVLRNSKLQLDQEQHLVPSHPWLLHNEYSDRPGFRRGISCDPTGINGDSGAARAVLNIFNPNNDVFISRDNVISGLANLKKCVGGACPRFGNPQSVADLIKSAI